MILNRNWESFLTVGFFHMMICLCHPFSDFEIRLPGSCRPFDCLELNASAAVQNKIIELHGMSALFICLKAHPVPKARQVFIFEISRHRKIKVRREKFLVDLLFSAPSASSASSASKINYSLNTRPPYGAANGAPTTTGITELASDPLPS